METFPKDSFKTLEARIKYSGEGKVKGVTGGTGDGELGIVFWIRGSGYLWDVKALVRLEV